MITLVTGFFNINRGEWKTFRRTNNTYLESFSKWAHLENELIVYVETKELEEAIIDIRSNYGLASKTKICVIKDIESIENQIYRQLKTIANNRIHRIWRLKNSNPEVTNADYNYVMFLKFWCLKHAAEELGCQNSLAWIDFGFAHNGALYPYEEDFAFEWDYDFDNKVTLFSLKELDERPAFDIINTMDTYIMGCIFVVPAAYAARLYNDIKLCLLSLLDLGYMDDDQILLLMVLRGHPEYITHLPSKWFLPIKQYGNEKMRIAEKNSGKLSFIKYNLRSIKRMLMRLQYYSRIDSHLKHVEYK